MAVITNCDVCGKPGAQRLNIRINGKYPKSFPGPGNANRDLCAEHSEAAGQRLAEVWEAMGVPLNGQAPQQPT